MTLSRDEIMAMTAEELRIEIGARQGCKFAEDNNQFVLMIGNARYGRLFDTKEEAYQWAFDIKLIPDYPSDIAVAWGMVEEIRRAGFPVAVLAVPDDYERKDVYEVKIYKGVNPEDPIYTSAYAPALAICRAWMIWDEEENIRP